MSLLSLLTGITARECGCCGRVEHDEVAELLLVEAVHAADAQRASKRQHDDAAWAQAHAAIRESELRLGAR